MTEKNSEDWFEVPHLTSGCQNAGDGNEMEGLFEAEMNEGKPMQMQLRTAHSCAKCGTGYAGPECKVADIQKRALEQYLNNPDGVFRVGPKHDDLDAHEATVRNLLGGIIGEDVRREGLLETPKRVVKAWKDWTCGYHVDIKALLKTFGDGAEGYDEMVVRHVPFYSHCEHHLAPIFGTATVAYIPNGRVVGLSKLDRLVDAYARRLQVQERLTVQIADALVEHLQPKGVGVHINARHLCVESRGVKHQNSTTITSALRGVMKDQPETRAEFMALVKE